MKGIINGKIIATGEDGHFRILERHVLLFDKKIIQLVPANYFAASQVEELIDAEGLYISPGFINTHIHGCAGFDTMDATEEALLEMAKMQATTGVTSFLPTTITQSVENTQKALKNIRVYMEKDELKKAGAKVLGAHVEGPFVNPKHNAAQPLEYIIPPNFDIIADYTDVIRIMTVAPEMIEPNSDFLAKCEQADIKLSIGHSGADYDTACKALRNQGFRRFTHICNGAMPGIHHRKPGSLLAALLEPSFSELITDNVHVVPAMQKLIWKAKEGKDLILITDSMRACGLGDGESELGGQKVFVKGNLASLENGAIAGSVAKLNDCVKNLAQSVNIPIWEAVECVTATPAKSLDMQYKIGSFEAGNAADIVLFDENVDVKRTIVDGYTVFAK